MELTKDAVANNIFSNRFKFRSFLLLNGTIQVKKSPNKHVPFLENANGDAIWIGKSIKKNNAFVSDEDYDRFAQELKTNPSAYEIGILRDSDRAFVIFKTGSTAITMAEVTAEDMGATAGAATVATVTA